MKLLKRIQILAMLPLLLAFGCSTDDDPTVLIPAVVSSNPAENDVDVAINSSIQVTFNKEMDPTTINSTSFSLKDGTNVVVGTVVYSN